MASTEFYWKMMRRSTGHVTSARFYPFIYSAAVFASNSINASRTQPLAFSAEQRKASASKAAKARWAKPR